MRRLLPRPLLRATHLLLSPQPPVPRVRTATHRPPPCCAQAAIRRYIAALRANGKHGAWGLCVCFLQTEPRHTYRAAHKQPCKATRKAREQAKGLPPMENCDQCRTSVSEIMLCLGCHQSRYCSAACQRDAWFVVVFFVTVHCRHVVSICPLSCKLINNFHTQLKGGSQETVQAFPERTRHGRGDSARGRGCACGRRRCAMLRALPNSLCQLASVHGLPLGVVLQHELPTETKLVRFPDFLCTSSFLFFKVIICCSEVGARRKSRCPQRNAPAPAQLLPVCDHCFGPAPDRNSV